MVDAHGCSVTLKQIKLTFCIVVNIHVFSYIQVLSSFTETQCKLSVMKHRMMFIFISYSAHFTGIRADSRAVNCCGGRLLHFDFYIQLLFLHTNAIDETALWISELSKFEHN